MTGKYDSVSLGAKQDDNKKVGSGERMNTTNITWFFGNPGKIKGSVILVTIGYKVSI